MRPLSTALLLAFLAAAPAFAATRTWRGVIDTRWSTPVNWDGGIPISGDDVVMATANSTNDDLPSGLQLHSLTIVDGTQISGNDVVLGAGGFTTTGPLRAKSAEDTYIGFSTLALAASQSWTNPARISYLEFEQIDLNGKTLTLKIAPFTFVDAMRGGGSLIIETGSGPQFQNSDGQVFLQASTDSRNNITVSNGFLEVYSGGLSAAQVNGGILFLDRPTFGSITMNGGELWVANRPFTNNLTFVESTNAPPALDVPLDQIVVNGSYTGKSSTIDVSGPVNLGNALLQLEFFRSYILGWDPLTIINNSGSAPISGTFLGVPEGTIINSRGYESWRVSYTGGDGNDVTVTHEPTFHLDSTTALTSSANPARTGQVTLTAAVGPVGAKRPQGSVMFYDGSVLLGTSAIDGSGRAALGVKLNDGTHTITAAYTGSSDFASSRGTLQVHVQPFRSRAARP